MIFLVTFLTLATVGDLRYSDGMAKEHPFIIYALHSDASDRLYIGQSSLGLIRPRRHFCTSNLRDNADLPVVRWIKKRQRLDQEVKILVLQECVSAADLNEAETFHIIYFRSLGLRLLNCNDGGDSVGNKTPEGRKKVSIALKKHIASLSEEERKKRFENIHYARSEEQKLQAALTRLGRKHSPEVIAKLNEVRRTPEYRAKAATYNLGKKRSESVRANISDGVKRSYALTGKRTKSPDTRARMSIAARNRKPGYVPRIRINLIVESV